MAKLKKAQNGLATAMKKATPLYKTAKAKEAEAAKGQKRMDYLNSKEMGGMGAMDRLVRKPKNEADAARKSADSLVVKGLTPSMKAGGMIKRKVKSKKK